tara:strand:+ start:227 stop:433 length:207 start_codon:yes stop_codon:yes gene_type:complete
MSSEQVSINNATTPHNDSAIDRKIPDRVDINKLMSKVREEKKKEATKNLVSFSVVVSVLAMFGLFLSL